MANSQALCTNAKVLFLTGQHNLGVGVVRAGTGADALKAALFLASGSLGPSTTTYTSVVASEVSGTNYSAGGVAVTNATVPSSTGTTAFWTPSASIVFTNVTLATTFDTMLLYNDQFATKNAIAVFVFGGQTITTSSFTLTMPTNDSSTALVRIA